MNEKRVIAYCRVGEHVIYEDHPDVEESDLRYGMECPVCSETLTPWLRLSDGEKSLVRFFEWLEHVKQEGLGGPSPGGASGELGCSRSMVDKLVNLGVLERSEYHRDGHDVVMISSRSIEKAKAAKKKHRKWTGGGEV